MSRPRPLLALAALVAVAVLAPAVPSWAAPAAEATQPRPGSPDAEVVRAQQGVCDRAPGLVGGVCEAVGDVVGGGVSAIVGGGVDAVLAGTVNFVVDGAGWLLDRLAGFIESWTRPQLRAPWFHAAYTDIAAIGLAGLLPFLLLALVQALLRQDAAMMLRTTFAYVPLAAIGTAAAAVVVDLLVQATDQLSAWVGRGLGDDLSSFATSVGNGLAKASLVGGGVAGLATLIGGALIAFAAFVIWLELLLRQAAIYVAVLFLPLGFMAMVWPATSHWLRRLAQGLVAIVLSKLVIVTVMALAASALAADVSEEGFAVVMAGGSLLGLAALAPYVLLRLIPVFDAELSGQLEGTWRRPTAAVGSPVGGSQLTGLLHRRAAAPPATAAPAASSPGAFAPTATTAASTAATSGAAGAAQAATRAASAGRDRAVRTATTATRSGDDGGTP